MAALELRGVRTKFVEKVSKAVMDQLLDYLEEERVLNTAEVEDIKEEYKQRAEKARHIIDAVLRKGDAACDTFLARFQNIDGTLYNELQLHPRPV
ncbi:caspase-1-like [Hypomesus transpacificus]|uniref:caspase-1-like n=1 Tax=Hypomesus transpacificus TaxID=137520 RepID=UPI001F08100E|nr:caspase-1-like [Hypomesus transpacificus]